MLLSRFEGIAFAAPASAGYTKRTRSVLALEISLWKTRACPDCLRTDGAWRLRWLLPWSVLCVRHERLLLSLCPACRHPLRLGRWARWPHDDRGPELGVTSCWQSAHGMVCRHPLQDADSPRVVGDPLLLAAQRRIDRILDGQTKPILAGATCEALQYLRDLRALVRLAQGEQTLQKHAREPGERIAGKRGASERTLADPARVAGALPKALAMADVPHPDALCDSIRALADKRYAESGQPLTRPREFRAISPLLREAIVHAARTASYANVAARFGFDPRRYRRPADLHPALQRRHVPQLYWREDYERDLEPLFCFGDFSPWMARRLCSVLLVRMLTPADWTSASRYLGLPEDFKHNSLHAALARFTSHGSLPKLIETIKRSASNRAASGGLIDYEQRRAHLATWQGIEEDTWPYLRPNLHPDPRRPDFPDRRANASVWLWCELTSGHERAAPIELPGTLNKHREFKERHLDALRERLLVLGQLLLDTPTPARSTIRTQLAATLTQRGQLTTTRQRFTTVDPIINERVLAHVSAHTGVDIQTIKTTAHVSERPAAIIHARLLTAALLRRTALASWTAIASTLGGAPGHLTVNDHAYHAALQRNPTLATELEQLVRAIEDWQTALPSTPTTPHNERMRDIAASIKTHAAELFTQPHTADLALRASMLACRAHTDLTWAAIAAIHDLPVAQPAFSRATVTHHRRIDPDFNDRYQQLLNHAQELRSAAGFANANLTRGLTETNRRSRRRN
jgi:hypothetical protein